MTILTVGSGQQYATLNAALTASHDGDTIFVKAGTYTNDFSIISTDVSIIGVGGMAHFVATQAPSNGKAILVTNSDVHIDHLEFSGAAVGSKNAAGIKYQMGTLTVTNSYFHDNQNGLLTSSPADGRLIVDHSEFDHNGAGDGFSHNIYVGQIASFQATNSYFHDAVVGHELKSRAAESIITGNRIADENGTASYSIDLPNGGAATISNNYIQQGARTDNPTIIRFGEDPAGNWANSSLLVQNNTIINQYTTTKPTGVMNDGTFVASVTGNHFYGLTSSQIASGPNVQTGNDSLASIPSMDTSHPWAASPWDNLMSGTAGADVMTGSAANDLLVGGTGADTFKAGAGADAVADFSHAQGDKIDLTGTASLTSLVAVLANAVQIGSDSSINLGGGNSLTLNNIVLAALTSTDFLFGGGSSQNAAPTDIALSAASVVENSANGTVVGALSATDPDAGDSFIYSLVSNPQNLFAINGANLVVAGPLDFETAASHTVTVRVTDSGGGTLDKDFVIAVTDVVEGGGGGAGGATIAGSSGNDVIDATTTIAGQALPTDQNDSINGAAGNDSIASLGGDDTLNGGAGIDTLLGGAGNDLYIVDNSADRATENPGEGTDSVQSSVTYVLGPNLENLTLTGAGDVNATGNASANLIVGNNGKNVLVGLAGADTLDGGTGVDMANYLASSAGVNVTLWGGTGTGGDAAGDSLIGIENVTGSNFKDTVLGDGANNVLTGENGDDSLDGALGNDKVIGGSGNDSLIGNTGNDSLTGSGGADTLLGGAGADLFIFAASDFAAGAVLDTIGDFSHAQSDKIDLSHIDANASVSGDQAFTFIGTQGFHHAKGELHYVVGATSLTVSADLDGNGAADFSFVVSGTAPLVGGDFIL